MKRPTPPPRAARGPNPPHRPAARPRPLAEDTLVRAVVCTRCGTRVDDCEPMGRPEFHHPVDPKRYCPRQGTRLHLGERGVAAFRTKGARRARRRGTRAAARHRPR